MIQVKIPYKLPSANDYINICRGDYFAANKLKKDIEREIGEYFKKLPRFEKPVKIHFHWIEANRRRDLDNICFAKKFILDALVKSGKLKDDNRKHVKGFTDDFSYGQETCVILKIEELKE